MAMRFTLVFASLLALPACSGGGGASRAANEGHPGGPPAAANDAGAGDASLADEPERMPPGACDDVASAHVTRIVPQARGSRVELVLEPAAAKPLRDDRDYAHCIEGAEAAYRQPFKGALTLLLVRPAAANEATLTAVESFLEARPADEAVGVALWLEDVTPVDMPTRDRARTLARLERALASAPVPSVVSPAVPVEALEQLLSFGGQGRALLRALVVFGDGDQPLEPPALSDGLGAYVLGLQPVSAKPAAFAQGLGEQLAAARAHGLYAVGTCEEERLSLEVRGRSLAIALPGLPWELERGPACAAREVALQALPSMRHVALTFSREERAAYDALVAANDKSDFTASFAWHDALPAVTATANLRGQSSLPCARKSYSIDLRGGGVRPLFPGFASDELFLISMCLDDGYINQITADRLLQELGLFPLDMRLVTLSLDGKANGVYLALEKPDDALRSELGTLHSVVRRRTDIDGKLPELDYARDAPEDALAQYEALVTSLEGLSGEALVAALEAELDLTLYLRWLALMSLLGNGDYIDELFFYATDGYDGGARPFYSVLGWDPDDLFSPCHHSGRFAIADAHGLLYCAEGVLEHRVLTDAVVYARYVNELEQVIAHVTEKRFAAVLDATLEELLPLFDAQEVVTASVELIKRHPEATTPAAVREVIGGLAAQMKRDFAAQRSLLVERITEFHAP